MCTTKEEEEVDECGQEERRVSNVCECVWVEREPKKEKKKNQAKTFS